MRIQITGGSRDINLAFPTGLVFNRGSAWIANTVGRHYAGDAMPDIPPEAMAAILAEMRRIKKKHGHWTLVEVKSSGGEGVTITL